MDPRTSEVEEIAACLQAYDNALASGSRGLNAQELPEELRSLLKEDLDCLHLLDELRLRPADQPTSETSVCPPGTETDERYRLTSLHAVGGIGQVWLAYDFELNREVALKELRPERADDLALQKRFLREARITGSLQHPGIVPVYEMVRPSGLPAGNTAEAEETPFYTMRFVRGRTLTEAVRDYHRKKADGQAGPLEFITLLNAFVSVCNTVAFANARGVIHRDLKGQNVVLGDYGEVIVLDWGLAKVMNQLDGKAGEERPGLDLVDPAPDEADSGLVLGTPAFMAPEQAAGRHELIDQRTDVYGLGAILFNVLTDQPPYSGTSTAEILRKAREGDAPRVEQLVPSTPPALAAVCAKAMARRLEDRYPSASALAREIQQWLADEPVLAYQEPMRGWLRRWARRHKPWVTSTIAIFVTCFLAILGSALLLSRERAKTAALAEEKADAETRARQNAERMLYFEQIALADRELTARNINRATQLLDDCQPELRGWEWHCLRRLVHTGPRSFNGHSAPVLALAFSADNRHLASAGYDRTARIWDMSTGNESFCLRGHSDTIYDIAYTPDGARLATASWDRTIKIWDAATGRELSTLSGSTDHVDRIAFASDGSFLVSLCSSGVINVWNNTGQAVRALPAFRSQLAMALFPDARHVAVAEWDKGIQVRDLITGTPVFAPAESVGYYRCLAVANDGSRFASGDGDVARGDAGQVKVWDFPARRRLFTLKGHSDPINAIAFSPDGGRLASASQDSTVKIWDLNIGREALTLRAHKDAVRAVAFSPDGQYLAAAGADRKITIWNASPWTPETEPDEIRTMHGHQDRVFDAAFAPDGKRLASVSADKTIRIWDPATAQELSAINFTGDVFAAAYSPDGHWLATALGDGPLVILDAQTLAEIRRLEGHRPGPIKGLAFNRDGSRLATASWDRTVRVWDVPNGRCLLTLKGHQQPVTSVAFSPDGRQIASGSYDKTIRLWDATTGREINCLRGHESSVFCVAFSSDARYLASASNDGTGQLWDAASGRPVATLRGHAAAVCSIAFSPASDMVATGSSDWTIQLWETATWRSLRTFRGHTDRVHHVSFSADGQFLASASFDDTVKLWKVPTLKDASALSLAIRSSPTPHPCAIMK